MNGKALRWFSVVMLVLGLGFAGMGQAQDETALSVNADQVFIDGYDVVAYFTTHKATRGTPYHAVKYRGAKFYFSSEENMNAFMAEPEKYMPLYNGFCAYAVANGKNTVKANPETFKLYNGSLLLFFDDLYEGKRFNTIVPWNADERSLFEKAQAHWEKTHR